MSKKRKPIPSKKGQKHFSKTAKKVHPKNHAPMPMRGGIRF